MVWSNLCPSGCSSTGRSWMAFADMQQQFLSGERIVVHGPLVLISSWKHRLWHSLEVPYWGTFNECPQLYVCGEIRKKIWYPLLYGVTYYFISSTVTGCATETELVSLYNQDTNRDVWAGVVFTNDFTSGWPTSISYKLRVALRVGRESRDRWRTDRTYMFFTRFGYRNNDSYGEEPCKSYLSGSSCSKHR